MAVSMDPPSFLGQVPVSAQLIGVALVCGVVYFITTTLASQRPLKNFPIASLAEEGLSPRQSWNKAARRTVDKGLAIFDGPFQVITGSGPKIVLPNHYADEIKNNPHLSLSKAFEKDFFAQYPGFEVFRARDEVHGVGEDFLPELVRTKLTQSLGLVTDDLVDETTGAYHDILGEDSEWHTIALRPKMLEIVARLSSRVFLGQELCRNERWLEIAREFTVHTFVAARRLRAINPFLRPIAQWFIEPCVRVRQEMADARKLIMPEVEKRTQRARKALAAGQKPPKTADTIGWMVEVARDKSETVNYVVSQMGLTMAAIHTTTEGLIHALIDLLAQPELIEPLRNEVIEVIGTEGWTKTALYKLRLMDSFLKESQRFSPPSTVTMNRYIGAPVTLSTGHTLPQGAHLFVATRYHDAAAFAAPQTFDAYRFLRARDAPAGEKPSNANSNQHVSITPAHMAFGYGQHACPGRFFASNEMKIALAHWLIKYEFRAVDRSGKAGAELVKDMRIEHEAALMVNPTVQLEIRRRVGLDEISVDL